MCRAFKFDPETKLHILELFDRDLAYLPARFVHQVEKARWGQVSPLLLGAQLCKHAFYFPLSRRNLLAASSVFTNTSKVVKVYLCQTFNGTIQTLADMAAHLYAIANGRDKFESTLPVDVFPLEILELLEKWSDHAHCAPFAPSLAIDDK